MINLRAISPRATNPPVWLVSLLAVALGCSISVLAKLDRTQPLEIESAVEEARQAETASEPTYEQILGQYTYQYFASTDAHRAYFRLLDGEREVFRKTAAKSSFTLQPIQSINLLPYGHQPTRSNFVIDLNSTEAIVVEQTEQFEDVSEQRHYLLLALAKPRILNTLDSGNNQLALNLNRTQKDKTIEKQYQLVGSDLLEAWGQQGVSPKVVFDLNQDQSKLHKQGPRQLKELIKDSKELQALFANLNSSEEAAITFAPPELAEEMAELIYEGNGKQAKFLLNRTWPKHQPGKSQFKKAFYAELAKSKLFKYVGS